MTIIKTADIVDLHDEKVVFCHMPLRLYGGRRGFHGHVATLTDTIHGFGLLWIIGGLRRFRRSLLRHKVEAAHMRGWLALAESERASNYALGVEVLKCRRLIKGYSDTHARGHSKFDRVLACLQLLKGRADAAEWLRRLREAALADADGVMLDGAVKTVRSFVEPSAA